MWDMLISLGQILDLQGIKNDAKLYTTKKSPFPKGVTLLIITDGMCYALGVTAGKCKRSSYTLWHLCNLKRKLAIYII